MGRHPRKMQKSTEGPLPGAPGGEGIWWWDNRAAAAHQQGVAGYQPRREETSPLPPAPHRGGLARKPARQPQHFAATRRRAGARRALPAKPREAMAPYRRAARGLVSGWGARPNFFHQADHAKKFGCEALRALTKKFVTARKALAGLGVGDAA